MRTWRWIRGPRARDEKGQAALEFAFVVPFVFVLIFFMVEGVSIFSTWMTMENASRAGARCGAVNQKAADVTTCTLNASGGLLTSSNVTVTGAIDQSGTVGNPVQVKVTYSYSYKTTFLAMFNNLLGGGIPTSIPLTAQTQMRLEEQTK